MKPNRKFDLLQAYEDRQLDTFEEACRQAQRRQETSALLEMFHRIRQDSKSQYTLELFSFELSLVLRLSMIPGIDIHIFWYALSRTWHALTSWPEIAPEWSRRIVGIAIINPSVKRMLEEMARKICTGEKSPENVFVSMVVRLLGCSKEQRAAFFATRYSSSVENGQYRIQSADLSVHCEGEQIVVKAFYQNWITNYKTKALIRQPPETRIIYKESLDPQILVERGYPQEYEMPGCDTCMDLGGVWVDGAIEGVGKCPLCKKTAKKIYGKFVSEYYTKNKSQLK